MTRRVLRDLRRLFSRRRALQGLGATVGAGLVGCKSDDAETSDDGTAGTSSGAADSSSSAADSSSSADESSSSQGSSEGSTGDGPPMSDCAATTDLSAAELLAPIEHIVVVCMENRSFDHMLGALALVEGRAVDGLTGRESNDDAGGRPVAVFHLDSPVVAADPPHGWNASHAQWNDGANDGFVTEYAADGAPDPTLIMGYYQREDLPVSYALADNYSLCERWFASVMGPTWPNRYCLHLASAHGHMSNDGIDVGVVSIFDRLTEAGISNTYYSSNLPFTLTYGKTEGVQQIDDFFADAAAGTLPQFCMVDPLFTQGANLGNDDHPPADVNMGQAFLATIHAAIAQSPLWERSLLVITYDEHGGFFDHVPPPTTVDEMPGFEQLGFRVPAIVIGPHVRRGCVSSTQFDHVSVSSTATTRWGLTPINDRVTATNDVSSCIDPNFLDDPQPPAQLPKMIVGRPQVVHPGASFPGQDDLAALADRKLPPHLDHRARAQQTMDTIIAWGVKLGAIELAD
ncbi:MAG TPA: alkaline phosphatase family protein [Nannocystaceae bacterium]|nr:alkaline phosphatase family protein [Nannocystaceae bacterium]